jgi:carbon monoxide dehydrogenase subunit G
MSIQGEYRIAAPRAAVWDALNDTATLQACIPGCESMNRLSDTEIEARILAQLGPIRSTFATRIVLSEMDPPNGYRLTGEGKGPTGFGKGSARVNLVEEAGQTVLTYTAELGLGGKLAQVGSRLVEAASRQLADQFFATLSGRLEAANAAAPAAAEEGGPDAAAGTGAAAGSGRNWGSLKWVIAVAVAAAVVYYLTRQ